MNMSAPELGIFNHGSLLALPLTLAAGIIAGLNPCCVALYPAAAATCCGSNSRTEDRGLKAAFGFILGVAAATTMLGVFAALAGRVMGQLGSGVRYAVAAVPLLMGLHLVGWLRLPIGSLPHRVVRGGWLGAFGTGFLLSLVLTPCGTPVLASLLSYVAYKGSIAYGAILLFMYGVGSGAPVAVVGTTAGKLNAKLQSAVYGLWPERISGMGMLALGLLLVWRA